jgi:hypothetical protein
MPHGASAKALSERESHSMRRNPACGITAQLKYSSFSP